MSEKAELAYNTAGALCRMGVTYMSAYGRLYMYEGGRYVDAEQFVRMRAQRMLTDSSEKSVLNEVVHWLCNHFHVEPSRLNPPGMVCVRNGVLIPASGLLIPHDPSLLFTSQLPVDWNPDAYHERADQFLDEVLPSPEARLLVEEMIGYVLLPDCRCEKAFLLTGGGGNGKSVFIHWLVTALGGDNVSAVTLQDLGGSRFRLAAIVDKLANVFADLPSEALKESGTFKALVSGDEMTAEHKFKTPFTFANRAKLIFSANELPYSPDATDAFFRRWGIIPFPRAFPEGDPRRDPHLRQKLETPEARSYLLRLAVDGLKRLVENERFTDTPETKEALRQYRLQTDSVRLFVEEECVVAPDMRMKRTYVYGAYEEWCKSTGLRAVSMPVFGRRLALAVPGLDQYQAREGGKRVRYYVGVATESEPTAKSMFAVD
jgi:putative DNA primase/helicase